MVCKVREARRQHLGVVALLHLAGSVVHRSAHIQQNRDACIGFTFEELDEELVAAAVNVPVDATDFVTGMILAVLRKIDTEAQIRRLMQARDESLDDGSRQQLHVLNANQNLGIDKSIPGSVNDMRAQGPSPSIQTSAPERH